MPGEQRGAQRLTVEQLQRWERLEYGMFLYGPHRRAGPGRDLDSGVEGGTRQGSPLDFQERS